MSKFERINSNRFGASQFRSIKQLVEYQKQETEREKYQKNNHYAVNNTSIHLYNPIIVIIIVKQ